MPRPAKLDDAGIQALLDQAPAWERQGDRLVREFTFANFRAAFGFMTQLAMVAEKLDHHPEWSNVYNRVEIAMTTHDVGGVSELDGQFIAAADAIAEELGGQ